MKALVHSSRESDTSIREQENQATLTSLRQQKTYLGKKLVVILQQFHFCFKLPDIVGRRIFRKREKISFSFLCYRQVLSDSDTFSHSMGGKFGKDFMNKTPSA